MTSLLNGNTTCSSTGTKNVNTYSNDGTNKCNVGKLHNATCKGSVLNGTDAFWNALDKIYRYGGSSTKNCSNETRLEIVFQNDGANTRNIHSSTCIGSVLNDNDAFGMLSTRSIAVDGRARKNFSKEIHLEIVFQTMVQTRVTLRNSITRRARAFFR